MYLDKKIIFYVVATIVFLSSFSGCILNEIFGTSFSLASWSVCDDEGFPGLSLGFSSSGTVTVKTFGPGGSVVDSELFLQGNNDAVLHLTPYRETVAPGQYRLKAYDKNNNMIFEETFSFVASNLSISSCNQKWWKQYSWREDYSLIGLTMMVNNNGDTPLYPHIVEVTVDSEKISGFVLPCSISAGESKYVDCFVYKEDTPEDSNFTVSLKDSLGNTLASNSFSIVLDGNVPTEEFKWKYKGHNRVIRIPYPEFLFDYYSGVDRILNKDYSVYVFDIYDDDYIDLMVDRLMSISNMKSDVDKINFAASFVQNLEYKSDSETNDSLEYPRYPVETLFNGEGGGGDCEDLSILAASFLNRMGYDVALFRLPNHMAMGVRLDENLSNYEHYTDNYYFLETTSVVPSCGYVPEESKAPSELSVYPVSSRPLLFHKWKNSTISIFEHTELGDFVKATLFVENLGNETAKNILVEGGFYTRYGLRPTAETEVISSLKPGMKKKITLMVDIPPGVTTWFKTKIYLDNQVVDEKKTASSFP